MDNVSAYIGYAIIYVIVALLTSFLGAMLLQKKHPKTFLFLFLLCLLLSLLIPVFGYVITWMIIMTGLLWHKEKSPRLNIKKLHDISYIDVPKPMRGQFGESIVQQLLDADNQPLSVRKAMLVAVNQFYTASVNRLNRRLLKDKVDEVRLFSQIFLEKQERILFQLMSMTALSKATTQQNAYTKRIRVQLMFERLYRGLLEGKMLEDLENDIVTDINQLLAFYPKDIHLIMMLVQVLIRQTNFELAASYLEKAHEYGLATYRYVSFKAEILFLTGKQSAIPSLMASVDALDVSQLKSIQRFWSEV
jgi:hypothetical protein